ncbi:MAG: alpha/beta hydrolase [Ilumatobacteraceae bacterium]
MRVLLVHGLGGTTATMTPLADALRRVGIDSSSILLPGHGTSPDHLATVGWDDWLGAVVDACVADDGVDAIVGQSLGGALALAAAASGAPTAAVVAISTPCPDPDAGDGLEWRLARGHTTIEAVLAEGETGYPTVPLAALLEMARGLLATDLTAVTVPTLLVQGLADDVVDPASVDVLASALERVPVPGPRVIRLADTGHVATMTPRVDDIASSIAALLGA